MQPLLLVSYGAPERQEDVVPFLNNLFAGKNVSADRIATAVQKYERYATKTGHYSPLNAECRKLIEGIRWACAPHSHCCPSGSNLSEEEERTNRSLPKGAGPLIYWGNLFWHPLLTDTIAEMAREGIDHAVCFPTSVFDSPPGHQRYADALESARQAVGTHAPILKKLPLPFDHPFFIEAQTDRLLETLAWHDVEETPAPHILFSAHSIPRADAARCHYVEQLQSTCRKVIDKGGITTSWELVYQSRSGAAEHWLGPDIKERIHELTREGQIESVIVSPIGFFCENMETEYDLDIEIGEYCAQRGCAFFRARAVGATPKICQMIVELVGQQVTRSGDPYPCR